MIQKSMKLPRLLRQISTTLAVGFVGIANVYSQESAPSITADAATAVATESQYISKARQLTLDGLRSGEGYFSQDGRWMVFQSEREKENPFYQIYLMDRETGDVERVSPGFGKTTCAWIHPDGERVLFASTQFDAEAQKKQKEELEFRASGQTRRYSWDYDPAFELVEWNKRTGTYKRLTDAMGYDAEASYSPDGSLIAFSSNRRAFEGALTEREKTIFANDPSAALDLYVMKSDGTEVKRITDVFGYDGGPFFSPDGKRICWRRFSEDGATAEIYSANVDGSDVQRLTTLGAMSWAPFFHPSGEYLIFTTNIHGFANFELYIVDAAGKQPPQRITSTEGFDGLPVFTPDGKQIAWTSNRSSDKKSQIYIADWNHDAARKALGLDKASVLPGNELADPTPNQLDTVRTAARNAAGATEIDYRAQDVAKHVDFLCRPELGGRLTGTQGEKLATAYVASYLDTLGLKPAGTKGDFFQEFPFTAGVELAKTNSLQSGSNDWKLNEDWRPLVFSKSTQIEPTEVVFAGYGIVAPRDGEQAEYDSYVHLDVENKWVMVLRQMPSDITPERRQHLARYSSLRFKAMAARDRGAKGIIVVSGPNSGVRQQLVPLQVDGSLSGTSIAAISVTDAVAEKWFEKSEDKLIDLQKELDRGELMMGFVLPEVLVGCTTDIQQVKRTGRNTLGLLMAGETPAKSMVIIGAHIDHLGVGSSGSSLALDEEKSGMHRGADDNASGVAAMLEIAQSMATQKKAGKLKLEHDILFAAWSGEEMGLLGSAYFSDHFFQLYPHMADPGGGKLYPAVIACFNLDMVGRLRDNLVLQGIGSSDYWPKEIEKRNAVVGLPLTLQNDSYLPTDASTFFLDGVPILSAFTGSHSEYHTPRDTPELLNYEGAASTAKLMGLIARSVALQADAPKYQEQAAPENQGARAVMTAYLGTIPDYAQGDIKGVMLSGVAKDGPASKAGVLGKDVIVELAGRKVENIYDYTYAIEAIKAGQETEIVVKRGEQTLRLKVTPQSRQ
ncbi:MAG: M20/M25/M40 family metallo-hydrolase [Pirellula sp.]|nr:M20/M25/M40 family metallo-hydrolase [Pirellula sp.]